ncbi:MAG: minor capsid protein [Erysipelotrichaceae bacterium]|nr:minor capsid protein [Erysipelotrichaceae bacterium]
MSSTMRLYEIRNWLKTLNLFEHYYIGKLDQKPDKAIGVYQLSASGSPIMALGNKSSYNVKRASLLIHWNNNARETDNAANDLFEAIINAEHPAIGNWKVQFINMLVPEPQDVGTDDKGIYESVIEIEIYYERK